MQTVMMAETPSEPVAGDPAPELPKASPKTRRPLLSILQAQLESLQKHHSAVMASDDPEAIHKMRVTTRRAQASLDLLEGQIDIRPAKRRLRRWRRQLSKVRNYDVFLVLLEKEAAKLRPGNRLPFELVRVVLQQRRTDTAARVREYLVDKRVGRLAARIGLLVIEESPFAVRENGGDTAAAEPAGSRVSEELSARIDELRLAGHTADRLDQRVAEFLALAAQSHPSTKAAELHELRIAAKRVRYLLEIVSEMGYGDAVRALAWLRNLQDRIGDWHDLESLEEEILNVVSQRDFLKDHLLESSRMLTVAAHLQKKKERLVAKVFPVQVPQNLMATSQRLSKALRRRIPQHKPSIIESAREDSSASDFNVAGREQ